MIIYLVGGLGADRRVFNFLDLEYRTHFIDWLNPKSNETLKAYSKRFLEQINEEEQFGLIGVSFGGMVVLEMAKYCNPSKLILISSVENSNQLPKLITLLGKTGILNLIPNSMIKPPKFTLNFLFGAENSKLLAAIINDTDPNFIRWALNTILKWDNSSNRIKPIRIHGTNDRLIPLKGKAIEVKQGGHFMIVDKAKEISEILNFELKK